ncbi:hypothetical protein ES705_38768 [subsurface metagenome]
MRTKEFYKLQNRVLEKLSKTILYPNEGQYCWTLFRETFGYGNLKAKRSRIQFSDFTGILEVHISRIEKRLKDRNIICKSGKTKGFNLDTDLWQKVPRLVPFQKVPGLVQKGTKQAEKKGTRVGTLLTKKKETSKKGGGVLKKLNYKETEKLEGKEWLRQVMWQRYGFKEKFVDEILRKWEFEACYDVLLSFEDSHNVRDKENWFLAKLERGPEPEE